MLKALNLFPHSNEKTNKIQIEKKNIDIED